MIHPRFISLLSLAAMTAMVVMANAQQAPEAAKPPDSSTTSTSATPPPAPAEAKPTGPSPDTLKKAKSAGYRAKLRRGETLFCKDQVEIGSHFSTEHCIDENQLAMVLEREQTQRDQLSQHACGGAGTCGGK